MTELKPIKCRAAVQHVAKEPMVIEQVEIVIPRDNQVRVKIVAAGVCASDASFFFGKIDLAHIGQATPIVYGHEGSGIVESVGDKITNFKPGDYVLVSFTSICRDCTACANPLTNMCIKENAFQLGPLPNKKTLEGEAIQGFGGIGVYSEYVLLKQSQVVKIDIDRAKLENSCIISCAVATGFYAAVNQARVTAGSTCAVWGLGAIGLNAIFGCKFAGAKNIIGIDINPDKRAIAEEFGCTEFINPADLDKPLPAYLLEKYGGIEYAIECIGSQAVLDTALETLTMYGTLAVVGVAPHGTKVEYETIHLLMGRTITGALIGNKSPDEGYPELVRMYQEGQYDIDRLISHRFKLEEVNDAFELLKAGKCIRSLILFD